MCKDEYGPVLTSVIEAERALSDCDYQNGNWERHFVRNDRSSTLKITPNDSHLQLLVDRIETPIGEMLIVADRDGNLRATFGQIAKHSCTTLCGVSTGEMDSHSSRLVIRMV